VLETAWGRARSGRCNMPCSGAPATSTSPSPGAAARLEQMGRPLRGHRPQLLSQYRPRTAVAAGASLEKYMCVLDCQQCRGARLNPQARARHAWASRVSAFADRPERSCPEVCAMAVSQAEEFFFGELELDATGQKDRGRRASKEIRGRLQFLKNGRARILTSTATAPTLSGARCSESAWPGKSLRVGRRVVTSSTSPSIGLHPRDNERLLQSLCRSATRANTVIVVEHDEDTMRAADHIVDFGPGPGVRGGLVVAAGPLSKVDGRSEERHGAVSLGQAADEIPAIAGRRATQSSWCAGLRTTI